MHWSQQFAKQDGIFVGISSGATFAGALRVAAYDSKGSDILRMLVDDDPNWHCVMPIWVVLHRIERRAGHRGSGLIEWTATEYHSRLTKLGGQIVKTEEYKQILLVKEREMLQQMGREGTNARESSDEEVHSWGDQSATDAGRAEEFGVADVDGPP